MGRLIISWSDYPRDRSCDIFVNNSLIQLTPLVNPLASITFCVCIFVYVLPQQTSY